jgi:hypothetical protein
LGFSLISLFCDVIKIKNVSRNLLNIVTPTLLKIIHPFLFTHSAMAHELIISFFITFYQTFELKVLSEITLFLFNEFNTRTEKPTRPSHKKELEDILDLILQLSYLPEAKHTFLPRAEKTVSFASRLIN